MTCTCKKKDFVIEVDPLIDITSYQGSIWLIKEIDRAKQRGYTNIIIKFKTGEG